MLENGFRFAKFAMPEEEHCGGGGCESADKT
jgi:hypothetical protein